MHTVSFITLPAMLIIGDCGKLDDSSLSGNKLVFFVGKNITTESSFIFSLENLAIILSLKVYVQLLLFLVLM